MAAKEREKAEGVAFSCLLTGYPNNHIRNDDCPR
jgi:hypothetical protein